MLLTIRSMIRWEALRGKPYAQMNPADADDLDTLLYVTSPEARGHTLQRFLRVVRSAPKLAARQLAELERESALSAQYVTPRAEAEGKECAAEPLMLGDVVADLALEGVPLSYMMDSMSLTELSLLLRAMERRRRDQLERERLWTYIGIAPILTDRRFDSPAKIYPFPWDAPASDPTMDEEDMRRAKEFLNLTKNEECV